MPPNFADIPKLENETMEKMEKVPSAVVSAPEDSYSYHALRSGLNGLAHTLIGFTVAMALAYALRTVDSAPLSATMQHIILCVLGYQLLMAEAILCFASGNGWSNPLKLKHKRLAHWALQLLGSGLAIAGSVIMMISRSPVHFVSNHAILGLCAMIFTTVSLVNGLASLYAYELRRFLHGNITKAGHICFGTAAFACASVCLCLGFDKNGFKEWSSPQYAYILMASTGLFSFIVIVTPLFNFASRLKDMASKD